MEFFPLKNVIINRILMDCIDLLNGLLFVLTRKISKSCLVLRGNQCSTFIHFPQMPNQKMKCSHYTFKIRTSEQGLECFLIIRDHHHYNTIKRGTQRTRSLQAIWLLKLSKLGLKVSVKRNLVKVNVICTLWLDSLSYIVMKDLYCSSDKLP